MFENLNVVGEFTQELNGNSLIKCPECRQSWGVKKWDRVSTKNGIICPGCEATFEIGTEFMSYYMDREFQEQVDSQPISKTGALGLVSTEDKLLRKDETL